MAHGVVTKCILEICVKITPNKLAVWVLVEEEDVTDSNVVGDNLFVGKAVVVVNLGSDADSTIGKQSTIMLSYF